MATQTQAAAKPNAISNQRRKVMERGASGTIDTPETNRAVGGSDRMLRSASKGVAAGTYGPAGHRSKRDDGTGAQWY